MHASAYMIWNIELCPISEASSFWSTSVSRRAAFSFTLPTAPSARSAASAHVLSTSLPPFGTASFWRRHMSISPTHTQCSKSTYLMSSVLELQSHQHLAQTRRQADIDTLHQYTARVRDRQPHSNCPPAPLAFGQIPDVHKAAMQRNNPRCCHLRQVGQR